VRYSAEEIAAGRAGKSRTDWARVDAMSQADVERLADEEDGALPESWHQAIIVGPPIGKRDIHIRLDEDILDWFKLQGRGYQTRINSVLRAFVQSRLRADSVREKQRPTGLSEADIADAIDWTKNGGDKR